MSLDLLEPPSRLLCLNSAGIAHEELLERLPLRIQTMEGAKSSCFTPESLLSKGAAPVRGPAALVKLESLGRSTEGIQLQVSERDEACSSLGTLRVAGDELAIGFRRGAVVASTPADAGLFEELGS
jgi:hypothetical protein